MSMLQRLTEDFEYSSCLDRAAACQDSLEQMAYVAAFTVSAYATTAVRTNKPFNPLLGETYECDRTDDLGWRSLAEQVWALFTSLFNFYRSLTCFSVKVIFICEELFLSFVIL
ncbi:unnamed protein product [Trichobilharzia regenti]|nr:unnamed protein product [Trichobilharzia regenti]